MYQGCNSRGVFSKLSNFPLSTMWKWTSNDLGVLVHFHIVERGKLESLESLENIPNFSNFFRGLKRLLVTQDEGEEGDRQIRCLQHNLEKDQTPLFT